jgi:hypothetical protein
VVSPPFRGDTLTANAPCDAEHRETGLSFARGKRGDTRYQEAAEELGRCCRCACSSVCCLTPAVVKELKTMPEGLPSSEELTSRAVGAFSLDTSVIQAASFSFSDGALGRLAEQLPRWIRLWLTDIVAREVMRHRMDAVRRAVQQVNGAQADLRRFLPTLDVRFSPAAEGLVSQASYVFEGQLSAFIAKHDGVLLDMQSPGLARMMFDRYFAQAAPFGGGRDKKHEFPDAASLILLEAHARTAGIKLIAVSADAGWQQFARTSEDVYCVPSLAELTGMFVATSANMRRFAGRVADLLSSPSFQQEVRRLLVRKLLTLPWTVEIRGWYHVDAGVLGATLDGFEMREESLKVWATPDESGCVAEVVIEIDCRLEVEAYAYRHKYKSVEKEDLSHSSCIVNHGFQATLVLEFSGCNTQSDPADALINMSLLEEPVKVEVTGIKFPGLDERSLGFDDMDDIPF